jgi:glycosyltransferase involved in cell wall biosynthesis
MEERQLKVEITVPVYDEEEELERNILKLYDYCEKDLTQYNWHITIADNASTDNTPVVSALLSKNYPHVSYFRLEKKGRGRAVKTVWSTVTADICIYMDLDLSTDLKHIPQLIKALEEGYDIAVGSRLLKDSKVEGRTWLREVISRTLNFFFIRVWFHTHFSDAQCGFKAVSKKVVEHLLPHIKDNGWFFDGEMLIVGEKSGYKIYEIPVHWVDNPGSTVRLYSTITGDIEVMIRLLRTKPWLTLKQ